MSRSRSPMAEKTRQARKYDALAAKDRQRRFDAGWSMYNRSEEQLSQLRTGTMFMFGETPIREREREMYEIRQIEERIAKGLDCSVTMLRMYPQVLVNRPEQVIAWCSHVTQADIARVLAHYQKEGK